jgi:hypothetical protein
LKAIEGVLDCRLTKDNDDNTTLEITMINRSRVLPQLLQIIVGGGAEVCNCQLQELPLEEIFTYALKREAERPN